MSGVRKHGSLIYVGSQIKFIETPCNVSNVVTILLPDYGVHLISVYRPHSSTLDDDFLLTNFLNEYCQDKETLLMGDFNLPSIQWKLDDPSSAYISPPDLNFYDLFLHLGLEQIIKEPTNFPSGNIIDLCLSSNFERIGTYEVLAPLPSCTHAPVLVHYVFQNSIDSSEVFDGHERLWSRGSYENIHDALINIDWDFELRYLDPQTQFDKISKIIFPLIDRHIPKKSKTVKSVPWKNSPSSSLKLKKTETWSKFKRVRGDTGRDSEETAVAWNEFRLVNEEIKLFVLNSQISYEKSLVAQINSHPKLFHSYIKHKKVNPPCIGPLKLPDGQLTDDPRAMAELFLQSFSGVFNDVLNVVPSSNQSCSTAIEPLVITPDLVYKTLKFLDPNKCMGDDGFHPRLLRNLASVLSKPLSILFTNSLNRGVLPDSWLNSTVVPIYKKVSRYDPLNYRPISITSVVCKTLERIIVSKIMEHLESNNLLSEEQYGFRSGRSTTDQLLLTYEYVSEQVDKKGTVDLVFFDFEKAFDKVMHFVLLRKLSDLGIDGKILHWIAQFLTNRRMRVRVGESVSSSIRVRSGVPQGTCLGPILFLVYINYVASKLKCFYKIFADDIKVYIGYALDSGNSHSSRLQADIDKLVETSESWGLSLNIKKCSVMRFCPNRPGVSFSGISPYKVGNSHLKFSSSQSDLGVVIDRQLKFHSHINKVVGNVGAMMTNLLASTVCRSRDFMLDLYTSHIRPKIEYASSVWNVGYKGDDKKLERLQRRWTRNIHGLENLQYHERLQCLNLFSVQGRLLRYDLIQVWKIISGNSCIPIQTMFEINTYTATRGHPYKLRVKRCRTEIRQKFFSQRTVEVWNSLKSDTVTASTLDSFKRLLQADLGQRLFNYVQ